MLTFNDPTSLPNNGESPGARLAGASRLSGTPGEAYVERRGIPVALAHEAGVRFDPDWGGRPAVIVALRDCNDTLCSVHGRYLAHVGEQNKMLTVGRGGGAISVLGGWRSEPTILVEGLFDALSLALFGLGSVATVGRWAPWLPAVCVGKTVWLAFDGNRPGEATADAYQERLPGAKILRLRPPGRTKDWNTALIKQGPAAVQTWLKSHLVTGVLR